MKLIIDIDRHTYELSKSLVPITKEYLSEVIANGTPYNPSGDLISREALKEEFKRIYRCAETAEQLANNMEDAIDNAPTVPLPNEQIAWEQGYEAGLAQGKQDRPQGEWIKDTTYGNTHIFCPFCKMHCAYTTNFCPNCGADMRKGGAK